jgi:hypothetical protein
MLENRPKDGVITPWLKKGALCDKEEPASELLKSLRNALFPHLGF